MKIILNLLLIALLFASNGCISTKVLDKTHEFTNETIFGEQIRKGDKVGVIDASGGTYYVIQYPKDKDNSKLKMPTLPKGTSGASTFIITKPHPAYYGLLPISVLADTVTLPVQIIVIAFFTFYGPPISQ